MIAPKSKRFPALSMALAAVAVAMIGGLVCRPSAQAQSCGELVVDGGFEAGGQGWSQASAGGYDLISEFNPLTGARGAYLGGVDDADDRLTQAVSLPSGASSIALRAWWSIATSETGGGFDRMTLSLRRQDGALLEELLVVDDSADPDVWSDIAFDLAAYAGQEVVLELLATTDSSNPTDFYVDDVSIVACVSSSTPTPTVTSTPTLTPTRTGSPTATPASSPTPTATPRAGSRYGYLPLVVATY